MEYWLTMNPKLIPESVQSELLHMLWEKGVRHTYKYRGIEKSRAVRRGDLGRYKYSVSDEVVNEAMYIVYMLPLKEQTYQSSLEYLFWDGQPEDKARVLLVKSERAAVNQERRQYRKNSAGTISKRILSGRKNIQVITPSGKVTEGRMATGNGMAILEPTAGNTAAYVIDIATVDRVIDLRTTPHLRVTHHQGGVEFLNSVVE